MYASEIFRESAFAFALPTERLQRLLHQLRSVLFPRIDPNRARTLHDVRLDVVSALGQTPEAYGWHFDGLLNVRMHTARDPVRAASAPPPGGEDPTPPDRGITPRVYRVPRARARPRLKLLQGGLAGGAA